MGASIKKPTDIKELAEFFWYLEDKYNLLDYEISGVKFWQAARMQFFYSVAVQTSILQQPHAILGHKDKIKYILNIFLSSFKYNYLTLKKTDVIIKSHARTVNINEEYIDIYTKYFIDELKENDIRILEFESAYLGEYKRRSYNHQHRDDWIKIGQKILQKLIYLKLTPKNKELVSKLEDELCDVLGIKIKLKSDIKNKVKEFRSGYLLYNQIFKKIKAKKLYIIVSYSHPAMIKAAKDNSMEVIELQHGTFSKYHLGYSFPKYKQGFSLKYFPNKFLVWSDYWRELVNIPSCEVLTDKFRFFDKTKEKYNTIEKIENRLVVISQGSIGEDIAKKTLENWTRFSSFEIKYKLHPGEFERWKTYPSLLKLSKLNNVEIVTSQYDLYELLSTSAYQAGVYSTALYEGVEFDCKTILFNLTGIEYMDKFISFYDVEVL